MAKPRKKRFIKTSQHRTEVYFETLSRSQPTISYVSALPVLMTMGTLFFAMNSMKSRLPVSELGTLKNGTFILARKSTALKSNADAEK